MYNHFKIRFPFLKLQNTMASKIKMQTLTTEEDYTLRNYNQLREELEAETKQLLQERQKIVVNDSPIKGIPRQVKNHQNVRSEQTIIQRCGLSNQYTWGMDSLSLKMNNSSSHNKNSQNNTQNRLSQKSNISKERANKSFTLSSSINNNKCGPNTKKPDNNFRKTHKSSNKSVTICLSNNDILEKGIKDYKNAIFQCQNEQQLTERQNYQNKDLTANQNEENMNESQKANLIRKRIQSIIDLCQQGQGDTPQSKQLLKNISNAQLQVLQNFSFNMKKNKPSVAVHKNGLIQANINNHRLKKVSKNSAHIIYSEIQRNKQPTKKSKQVTPEKVEYTKNARIISSLRKEHLCALKQLNLQIKEHNETKKKIGELQNQNQQLIKFINQSKQQFISNNQNQEVQNFNNFNFQENSPHKYLSEMPSIIQEESQDYTESKVSQKFPKEDPNEGHDVNNYKEEWMPTTAKNSNHQASYQTTKDSSQYQNFYPKDNSNNYTNHTNAEHKNRNYCIKHNPAKLRGYSADQIKKVKKNDSYEAASMHASHMPSNQYYPNNTYNSTTNYKSGLAKQHQNLYKAINKQEAFIQQVKSKQKNMNELNDQGNSLMNNANRLLATNKAKHNQSFDASKISHNQLSEMKYLKNRIQTLKQENQRLYNEQTTNDCRKVGSGYSYLIKSPSTDYIAKKQSHTHFARDKNNSGSLNKILSCDSLIPPQSSNNVNNIGSSSKVKFNLAPTVLVPSVSSMYSSSNGRAQTSLKTILDKSLQSQILQKEFQSVMNI